MNISIEEFKSFLGPKFTLLDENASKREYVFEMKIDNTNLVIKVFSSISRESEQAYYCPIRVCVVDIVQKIGWLKTAKVIRNENWKSFLTKTINCCIDDSLLRLENFKKSISLREIKLTLANPETFNISQIWTSTPDFFTTEVSILDKFKEKRRRDLCPKCNWQYSKKNMIRLLQAINFENGIISKTETLGWTFQCSHCNSLFKIVNN